VDIVCRAQNAAGFASRDKIGELFQRELHPAV
jgi:hypothetical protein